MKTLQAKLALSVILAGGVFLPHAALAGPLRDNFLKAQELSRQATEAYRAGDAEGAVEGMVGALELRPGHVTYTLQVAALAAGAGDSASALSLLYNFAQMGAVADIENMTQFAELHDSPAFQNIAAKVRENAEPIVASSLAFTLDRQTGLTESIVYDQRRGRFIVSSISERTVFGVNPDGTTEVLVSAADNPLPGGPMGLAVDPLRNRLWITNVAIEQARGVAQEDIGGSGVFYIELGDNRVGEEKDWLPGNPAADLSRVFGDLTVASDGIRYISDGASPTLLYDVHDDGRGILNYPVEEFVSAQGMALTPDEDALIVADYALGLLRVEREADRVRRLDVPLHANVRGIDGLYRYKDGLIAIQNGARPKRILYLRMRSDWREVASVEVLERGVPEWEEPTLGVIVGDEFYYIANAGWTIFFERPPTDEELADRGHIAVRKINLSGLHEASE